MSRSSDRDAALLLLLLMFSRKRGSSTAPSWNPLPPGPPAPFPPPGIVPVEPATPDPSLLESFQRAVEETFRGSPIDLDWWRRKLEEWRTQPRPPREPLPWE
jgi:hypothetical protein